MKQMNHYSGDDFTFVVCAYKECPYLEESIRCLKNQTVKAKILISTSTPNDYIKRIAKKYDIEVRVNYDGGQVKDYNFAMKQAETELVMIAHQDEVISKKFVEKTLKALNYTRDPIIAFTNYIEMHNDIRDKKPSMMVRIKRILLLPLRIKKVGETKTGKRLIQCIGNPITHPTVVCVRKKMPDPVFREAYKAAMDWDLWERLSKQEGSFVYVRDVLLCHRMNDANQTSQLLQTTNVRYEEEFEIFCRFWPSAIVKMIMKFYTKAAKYY